MWPSRPIISKVTDTLADRTFAVLARHKVPGVISAALPLARKCERLSDVVSHLIPSRAVFYDAEWVYKPEDLVELLQRFAAATDWDWELTDPHAEFHPDPIQRRATVEFRWKGSLLRSTFVQDTDWIASEFVSFVLDFARAELPGVFIKLPFVDQVQAFIYIERAAEAEILTLMTETPPAINFRKSGEVR